VCRSSFIRDPGAKQFSVKRRTAQRKKKGAKKKESRGLWKLPQPWKSAKVALGDFFLLISTAAWKSRRKKRSSFSTVTTGPEAINN
jgi:hypothetical protein